MPDLTLRACRLPGRDGLFDIAILDGRIRSVSSAVPQTSGGDDLSLEGRLVLPALADGHLHLDKTFLGEPWRPHIPGDSIAKRIAAERSLRAKSADALKQRMHRLVDQIIGHGTLTVRSHVDVDEDTGLAHVMAMLELRAELGDRIDLQIVAFPQGGIKGRVADLLVESLRLGVDVIGGLDPAGIDDDIDGHLDTVFGLAGRHGCRIDIHLHDAGTLGTYELRQIAARARAQGLEGRVAVSHAFALGMVDAGELRITADALAAGGVAIMTNGPGPDAMPPLQALRAAGVTVFGGSDNIRDAWSPYGNGDLLRRAGYIGYRGNLRTDDDLRWAYELVTVNSRQVMGVEPVAVEAGSPADLIALPVRDIPEAVADAPAGRIVIRRGRLVKGL